LTPMTKWKSCIATLPEPPPPQEANKDAAPTTQAHTVEPNWKILLGPRFSLMALASVAQA